MDQVIILDLTLPIWHELNILRTQHPRHGIKSLQMAGHTVYFVTDVDLAAQIYKDSKNFSFDPLALRVSSAFGCEDEDVEKLDGTVLARLHKMSMSYLQGTGLDAMTDIFMGTLADGIERFLERKEEYGGKSGWIEVDLVQFVKRQWSIASTTSLYGTKLLEREGEDEIFRWLWNFDVSVMTLMAKLPDLVASSAARSRDQGLNILTAWERAAKDADRIGEIDNEKSEAWDPYWGLNFCRERGRVAEDEGVSEKGRAAMQVALLWGLNANAIPVATWTILQALAPANSSILPTVLAEISACRTENGGFNVPKLTAQPQLMALLKESYRWSVSSPGVRVVLHDTVVGPYTLLKGGTSMVHSRTLQLSPSIWGNDAHLFSPSRFLPLPDSSADDKISKVQRLSMRHFGGGHNLCPGRHFAGNEILGGLAVLLETLEIEVLADRLQMEGVPEVCVSDGKQGGLWPDRGFWVRIRRRT